VLGRDIDRPHPLLARCLAKNGPEATLLRTVASQTITGGLPKKGGILVALRRSLMVGADLDLTHAREEGRKVEL
jgi:hypothetical protein